MKGMVIASPSFGLVTMEWAIAVRHLNQPINFGAGLLSPTGARWDWHENKIVPDSGRRNIPVADARNIVAQWCLDNNVEWLFFIDDDTIPPPHALTNLYHAAQKLIAAGEPISCIGGHYPSKATPPTSLILVDGTLGGYENWRAGEIVGGDNTAIGMGCTLIHVPSTIAKMPGPWFKTVESLEPHLFTTNPLCNVEVDVGNDIQDVAPMCIKMTEDVYFIRKMKRIGMTKCYCDTGVLCQHIDANSFRKHYHHPSVGRNVWEENGIVQWMLLPGEKPPINDPNMQPIPETERPKVVRFDLGTPGHKDGWITVDLFEKSADEQVDITNMQPLINKYGLADELRCSHILEHFPFRDTPRVLKEWVRALKPGGLLHIEVPDAEWGCENLLKNKDATPDVYLAELYKLIGLQTNPGDFHKTLFCKSYLAQVLADPQLGLEDVVVEFHSYPDPRVQRAIRAWATKKRSATPEQVQEASRELVLQD